MSEHLLSLIENADIIMRLANLSEITFLLGEGDKKLTITPDNHKKIVKELKNDDLQAN